MFINKSRERKQMSIRKLWLVFKSWETKQYYRSIKKWQLLVEKHKFINMSQKSFSSRISWQNFWCWGENRSQSQKSDESWKKVVFLPLKYKRSFLRRRPTPRAEEPDVNTPSLKTGGQRGAEKIFFKKRRRALFNQTAVASRTMNKCRSSNL